MHCVVRVLIGPKGLVFVPAALVEEGQMPDANSPQQRHTNWPGEVSQRDLNSQHTQNRKPVQRQFHRAKGHSSAMIL